MNNQEFQAHLAQLRRLGPTWANLRVIGNSRPVQIATVFPIVGYFILLSTQFTNLIDGGIAGPILDGGLLSRLWSLKLYFVYFGLISLGIGSAVYQVRCPRIIKSFADNSEFVRIHSPVVTLSEAVFMASETAEPAKNMSPSDYLADYHRIPIMMNFYALQSAVRPWSRLLTTIFFYGGFALLAVPSALTFVKVGRLLATQLLG
jgi:hypothetical protein